MIFAAGLATAQPNLPVWHEPDLSLGTYFWFVALNSRCRERNTAREAAIEKYRRFFFSNLRAIAAQRSDDQNGAMSRRIDELEKEGPAKETVEHFETLLAQGRPAEIEALCRSAESDVGQMIDLLKAVAASSERARMEVQPSQSEQ